MGSEMCIRDRPTAGPCLCSRFDLGFGEYLIMVILKARNQEQRFVETKKIVHHTLKKIEREDLLYLLEGSSANKEENKQGNTVIIETKEDAPLLT